MRSGRNQPQRRTITRFLNDLNPNIANKVEIQTHWTLKYNCKFALKVEKQKKEKKGSSKSYSNMLTPFKFSSSKRIESYTKEEKG